MCTWRALGRDTGCLVSLGFGRVSNIRDAKVNVAALIGGKIGLAIGQGGGCAVVKAEGLARLLHSIAVGIRLAVDGVSGRGNTGLVEGYWDDLVTAKVADVSELDGEVIARLPLDVQGVVDGVGQLVVLGVVGEGEHLRAVGDLSGCRKVIGDVGCLTSGLVGRGGAKRGGKAEWTGASGCHSCLRSIDVALDGIDEGRRLR